MTDMLKLQQKLLPAAYKLQSFRQFMEQLLKFNFFFAYWLKVIKLLPDASEDEGNIRYVIYQYFNVVFTQRGIRQFNLVTGKD